MKYCCGCKETKNLEHFSKNRSKKDGLQIQCKKCNYDYGRINCKRIGNRMKIYTKNNEERFREYRVKNKEKIAHNGKQYEIRNRHRVNSNKARGRANKRNATPNWLTKEMLKDIQDIYKKAKELEKQDKIKRHVDHIIPLQNKLVCGLHVPWNLQILTAKENQRKYNVILPEYT